MKRTGKMLLSILALALVFAAFCCCASADSSGKCGDHVNWSLDTATGELTLSGAGPTWDYTDDDDKASPFYDNRSVRSVVVTDGITRIGDCLFDECCKMQSVSLPGSLQSIGAGAFECCSKLSVLRIPKDVETIGHYAFYGCSELEDVFILSRSAGFGKDVFRSCSDSLTLHGYAGSTAQSYAKANGISFEVFAECDLVLPDALTTIEADAFRGINAASVLIPQTVKTINGNPFAGSKVTTICGCEGSAAQTFAKQYGYTFQSLG